MVWTPPPPPFYKEDKNLPPTQKKKCIFQSFTSPHHQNYRPSQVRNKRSVPNRNKNCAQGKQSLHPRWKQFISTFTELHSHSDERWPTEVTSNMLVSPASPSRCLVKDEWHELCVSIALSVVPVIIEPCQELPTSPVRVVSFPVTIGPKDVGFVNCHQFIELRV